MEETTKVNTDKEKNSYLSIILIGVNLLLAYVLSITTKSLGEEHEIITLAFVIPTATILLGAFAFTYHGKSYRWAKWLFGICLIISIALLVLLFYVTGLSHAFQH